MRDLEDLFAPQEWIQRVKWVDNYPPLNQAKPKHVKIKHKEDTWQNESNFPYFHGWADARVSSLPRDSSETFRCSQLVEHRVRSTASISIVCSNLALYLIRIPNCVTCKFNAHFMANLTRIFSLSNKTQILVC